MELIVKAFQDLENVNFCDFFKYKFIFSEYLIEKQNTLLEN